MINFIYSNMKKDVLEFNVFIYNVFLKVLCKNGRVDGVRKLFDEMFKKGCLSDEVSYIIIVLLLCKDGKVKEVREFVNIFVSIVFVYNVLISGYC